MFIALIEDNFLLWENIKTFVKLKNIQIEVFESVEDFPETLFNEIDVLVLDINLPGKNGDEYLVDIRQRQIDIPVIMLTSQNTSDDIVEWLEKGADDYISKPFNFDEFIARLHVASRRKIGKKETNIMKISLWEDNYELNINNKSLKKNDASIYLPTLEFDLFHFLVKNRGKTLDRATIYEEVWWEFDKYQLSRSVDVYVWYIRKKLWKEVIQTKKSFWYFIES